MVEIFVYFDVLEEVRVAAEYVYAVAFQRLGQPPGVAHVVAAAYGVPCRGVHVQYHERAFGHVAQVFFKPCYLCVGHALDIPAVACVVDVFHRNDVGFAYVERIIRRAEPFVILHFAVHGRAEAHVMQVLPTLVEVVVADALEHRHACVFH